MASTGREAANSVAGVILQPTGDPGVPSSTNAVQSGGILVPVFNVVDGEDTTQKTISDEIAKVFEIQARFYEDEATALRDMDTKDLREVIREALYLYLY
jgi:hypothetical protein